MRFIFMAITAALMYLLMFLVAPDASPLAYGIVVGLGSLLLHNWVGGFLALIVVGAVTLFSPK